MIMPFSNQSAIETITVDLATASIDRNEDSNMFDDIRSSSCPETRRDSLAAMMDQEGMEVYRVCDYLGSYDDDDCGDGRDDGREIHINATCRTSICEWMYRVVDHFGVDREVVSIAASYIDRVLSICFCPDRRTFKLISSAALHLAIKIHSPWQWKEIGPLLPDLSRGDFDSKRIVEMESEITHWLKWYLNQSTPQCMVLYLLSLLKGIPDSVLQDVMDMAIFLIEMSVCDYEFVTTRNSIIAIAAVLNATERMGFDLHFSERDSFDFRYQIETVLSSIDYKVNRHKVSEARERLWSLYRNSTECSLHESMIVPPPIAPERPVKQGPYSPTSCIDTKRIRSRSDFAYPQIYVAPSLEFSISADSTDTLVSDAHTL